MRARPADLEAHLEQHGHLLPLPKEPAALANVLEVSIAGFLLGRAAATGGQLSAAGAASGSIPTWSSPGQTVQVA